MQLVQKLGEQKKVQLYRQHPKQEARSIQHLQTQKKETPGKFQFLTLLVIFHLGR